MSNYSPEYISQRMGYVSGDTVTADEFNAILNKIIHQGDHNSEWLEYLDKIGIPAAIAEITSEDIEEFISEQVEEQLAALSANSASRTTGYTTTKDIVIVNTSVNAVDSADFAGVNNLWQGNSNTVPDNAIPTGYSGADIINLTTEARASDCSSLRTAMATNLPNDLAIIYQGRLSNNGISESYLTGNLAGYVFKATTKFSYSSLFTLQNNSRAMQFPLNAYADTDELLDSLDSYSIDDCAIVGVPLADLTLAELTALRGTIVAAGFNIITFKEFYTKWLNNFVLGGTVYASKLLYANKIAPNNVLTDSVKIAVNTSDGNIAIFNYADILKASEDRLTFTENDGSLIVTNSAGETLITYSPAQSIIDNTLVGNTNSTSELPIVVTTTGSGSGKSFTNNTIKAGNGVLKVNNKSVIWVDSYDAANGVLVLGGL